MILLVLMLGFILTGIETRYLHQVAVHTTMIAWVPILVCAAGVFACVFGMLRGREIRTMAIAIFLLIAAIGVGGIYMHTDFDKAAFVRLFNVEDANLLMKDVAGDIVPPPIAPGILTGLGVLGALSISTKRS